MLVNVMSDRLSSALLGLPEDLVNLKRPVPSPGGQVSGMASHQKCRTCRVGRGVASPRPPARATTRQPGGRALRRMWRFRRGLPPGWRVVGRCQVEGTPHDPGVQDRRRSR
jgi:hypothetical protein